MSAPDPAVRVAQARALVGFECRRWFLGARGIPLYALALSPPTLLAFRAAFLMTVQPGTPVAQAVTLFAWFWQGFFASVILYLLCLWLFTSLFRLEVSDGTLHYFFLSPVRRETILAAKYLAGLLVAAVVTTLSLLACQALLFLPHGAAGTEHLLSPAGLRQAGAYFLATFLACVGYGAVFLLAGALFRNPIIPGAVFWGWERINFLLPPILKKISVVYYLDSLSPVPVPNGPFAIVSEPISPWLAVPGLLVFSLGVLGLATWKVRRMEVLYGGEV